MTHSRRRSMRNSVQESQELSPLSTRGNTPTASDPGLSQNNKETCPACIQDSAETQTTFAKENWILCDSCKSWYHWRCAGNGGDVGVVDKWSVQSVVPFHLNSHDTFAQVLQDMLGC